MSSCEVGEVDPHLARPLISALASCADTWAPLAPAGPPKPAPTSGVSQEFLAQPPGLDSVVVLAGHRLRVRAASQRYFGKGQARQG